MIRAGVIGGRLLTVMLVLCPVVVGVAAELMLHQAETGDAVDVALHGNVENQVVEYLHAQRVAQHVPGMELAIVRDGRLTRAWAEGEARPGTPITPRTAVQLASVSKALTAVAVMQLVGAGELDLEQPVVAYLPWFTTADHDAAARITIGELLHHTSGLDDDAIGADQLNDASPAALEHGVRVMADSDLAFTPGEGFRYANANYDLLGLLVQERSGERFSDYMREHVFTRMGMADADADPVSAMGAGAADGYYRWFGLAYRPSSIRQPLSQQPAATLYASAVDLAQELVMNLHNGTVGGTRVLSARQVRKLHTSGADTDGFTGYAGGWYVRPLWEAADPATYDGGSAGLPLVYEHSGEDAATTTFLGFVPSLDLGAVVLMNSHDSYASSRLYALQSNVWKILLGRPPSPVGDPNEPFLRHQAPVIGLVLLAVLLSVLVATARVAVAGRRATPARRWVVLVGALVFDVAVLWFVWVYGPHQVNVPVRTILRTAPDIAILMWVCTTVVVLWAPIRTYLLARSRRARDRAPGPANTPSLATAPS